MRRWHDKYFQKYATSFVKNIWRRASLVYDYVFDREKCLPDRYVLWGIMVLSIVGLVYATFVIQNSSKINVDSVQLAQERREQLQKKRASTPLRTAPFAMPEIPELTFPDRECSIVDFGAVSGGKASNTESFRKAIASCASAGGGRVSVPKGTWLTGAIHLKSNINLFLDEGAVILFSDNHKEYLPAVFSRFEGIELYNYSSFIYAKDSKNIAITGTGELHGNGDKWRGWDALQEASLEKLVTFGDKNIPVSQRNFATEEDTLQPSFIQCVNCKGVLIDGVNILDSPSWTIHLIYSENIMVRNVDVYTGARNTDGIVLDSSRNAIVQDSLFRAGDDAIVIKSGKDRDGLRVNKPSENIVIHDCVVEDGHGGVTFGSEMSGGIRNVFAYNIDVRRADFALRFKSMMGRGGVIENIFIEDVTVKKAVFDGIHMDMNYGTPLHSEDRSRPPVFRNISFKNVSVEYAKVPYYLIGIPESLIRDITFENVSISSIRAGKVEYVSGEPFRDISLHRIEK